MIAAVDPDDGRHGHANGFGCGHVHDVVDAFAANKGGYGSSNAAGSGHIAWR